MTKTAISRYVPGYGKPDYLMDVWESELVEIAGGLEDLVANLRYVQEHFLPNQDNLIVKTLDMGIEDAQGILESILSIRDRESVFEEEK